MELKPLARDRLVTESRVLIVPFMELKLKYCI